MSWKNVSTYTVRRRLSEADLYGRIAIDKPLLKKQINIKSLHWTKERINRTIEQWNKVLWTDKSKFEVFRSNRRIYTRRRVGERAATPSITPTIKHGGSSLTVWGLLPIAKSGIYTRFRANWIRQTITAYCSITRSHLERGLWLKDLYLCKIMTQSIRILSARVSLKEKKNSTSINWCLGQRNQWT